MKKQYTFQIVGTQIDGGYGIKYELKVWMGKKIEDGRILRKKREIPNRVVSWQKLKQLIAEDRIYGKLDGKITSRLEFDKRMELENANKKAAKITKQKLKNKNDSGWKMEVDKTNKPLYNLPDEWFPDVEGMED